MCTLDLSPSIWSFRWLWSYAAINEYRKKWDSNAQTYPPYNIERMNENAYRITIAVAGFSEKDSNIIAKENILYLTGNLDGETLKMWHFCAGA